MFSTSLIPRSSFFADVVDYIHSKLEKDSICIHLRCCSTRISPETVEATARLSIYTSLFGEVRETIPVSPRFFWQFLEDNEGKVSFSKSS